MSYQNGLIEYKKNQQTKHQTNENQENTKESGRLLIIRPWYQRKMAENILVAPVRLYVSLCVYSFYHFRTTWVRNFIICLYNFLVRDLSPLTTTTQNFYVVRRNLCVVRNGLHAYQCYSSHMTTKKCQKHIIVIKCKWTLSSSIKEIHGSRSRNQKISYYIIFFLCVFVF